MHSVVGILLGTICSGGGSLCLGACVFRRLNLRFERIEHLGLALVVGAACFSQIVFFLCSFGMAWRNAFLAIALLSAIFAVSGGINTSRDEPGRFGISDPDRHALPGGTWF